MHINIYSKTFLFLFIFSFIIRAQVTYQGPVTNSVDTGAVVNTSNFADSPVFDQVDPIFRGENTNGLLGEPLIINETNSPFPVTYTEDAHNNDALNSVGDNSMLLNKWDVQLDNSVIPPDPTCAVGPDHVIVLTNNGTGIRIYDKQGNLLKSINSTQWWSAVWPSQSGDPQIIYDQFSGRWVMVFMQVDDVAFTAGDLIAYSDDSDPMGTWYMYRLPSTLWGDYPQIGFDDEAIYIATNNFTFSGVGQYAKVRIISKAELYSSNAGHLSYKDIWNISLPNSANGAWNLRPSFHYSHSDGHYLVYANRNGGNFYSIYKLSNPTTTPSLTGVSITVPFYGPAPNANQLGGGTPLIESGGSPVRTAPIFRDGFLYATHSIRNTVYPTNSSIKYFKVNVSNNTVVESAELGAQNYYYIYPTIAVDKDANIFITASRSANSEYIGAYYTCRRNNDPAGLSPAKELQAGLGNYIKTFGGDRNRWGDYMGIFLDPSDEYSAWMFTEYAATNNNYATVVGQVRLKPFPGFYVNQNVENLDFGTNEIGITSDTLSFILSNYGDSTLIINSIPAVSGDFNLVSDLSFPVTLNSFDSLEISFTYTPATFGQTTVLYPINNNSTSFSGIELNGFGYYMNVAEGGNLFALSGSQNNGNTAILDKTTGTGTNIGYSNYSDFTSIAINPNTNQIYGLRSSTISSSLYRVNADSGDAYLLSDLDLPDLQSIAFDTLGNLFATSTGADIYSIDTTTFVDSLVVTMPVSRVTIAFNPLNNELWGSVRNPVGSPKDRIIKIDIESGDTTRVGQTGFSVNTIGLTFDHLGNLFGIKGTGSAVSDLFSIDTSNAAGTIIGSTGLQDLKALGYSLSGVPPVNVSDDEQLPTQFSLSQNYPNPFNPSTQIRFALPVSANVKITIFNLLGEVVKQLSSREMTAGNHTVSWNAEDAFGNKVSSGIYFYELNANGADGSRFSQVRKMMLLK